QMRTRLREILVDVDAGGDAPQHHRSLDAALDVSYQLLRPDVQIVFAWLSVFRGGWTLDQAETICIASGSAQHMLSALSDLHTASLVTAEEQDGEMRYGMLETVRAYAEDRLNADGDTAARVRRCHRDLFLDFAREMRRGLHGVGQDLLISLARLEREYPNLQA